MKNQEIANIFYEIADFLEMEGIDFRPFAYRKAASVLEGLEKSIGDIYKEEGRKGLEKVPGVGIHIAARIEEFLRTGKIKYYEELKKKTPINVKELIGVEGLGPKRVKFLYQKLKIKNLKDLEESAKKHKIAFLPGFGEKTEKNILEGIAFLKRSKGRFLLGDILPEVKEIIERLKNIKGIDQISPAGSVRRMKETIGDVDVLITTKEPAKVMDFFVSMPGIVKVWGKGPTKASIRMRKGFDIDLRVLSDKSYGSALQYFTGSKEHNIVTRRMAIEKNLKLNEYGVFRGKKMIAGWDEEGIYKALGIPFIEPELRENQGEIEAALERKLPKLIGYKDIKGDLHCHSNWNGGKNSIIEIAKEALSRGYKYVGISDHTNFLKIEHGLNEKKLEKQGREIDKLNEKFKNHKVTILKGAETNILSNGLIDVKDETLKRMDYAIAGVHSNFKMEKEMMTERIIRAMKNPYIKILSHPTGRILKQRDEYRIDFDKILRAAKEYNVALEINASPVRLDLNDRNIKRAKQAGVKMIINADSHNKNQMEYMELGVSQARRGWAEKDDIINAWPLKKLISFFSK